MKIYRVRELWDKLPCLVLGDAGINRKTLEKTAHVLFSVNTALVVYAILQKYGGLLAVDQPLIRYDHRMVGYFGHPLHYGGYISIVLLMALALSLFHERRFAAYLPLLLAGLVLSGSRSYFIGISVAGFILMGLKSRKIVLVSAAIAPVAALITVFIYPDFGERISSAALHESFTVRMEFWSLAWQAFLAHPFFGLGYEEFSNYLIPYLEKGMVVNHAHAHNLYLQELADGGIVGGALIVATFIYFIRKYYLCFVKYEDPLLKSFAIGICTSYICLAVAGITEYNFGAAVVWLLLTFLMGLAESYKNTTGACSSER
jgi:O-antigen ligase